MDIWPLEISVRIHNNSRKSETGKLVWTRNGLDIIDEDSSTISHNHSTENTYFSIVESSVPKNIKLPLSNKELVKLKSVTKIKRYSSEDITQNEMYPKSTDGWITHMDESGNESLFILNEIENSQKMLLIIGNLSDGSVLSLHKINSYESEILVMERDWDIYTNLFKDIDSESRKFLIQELLDKPAPEWSELAHLVEGVNVPNLRIGNSMRDTISQLIPKSFPADIREELMAFLALIVKLKIPEEDPLVINTKYRTTPILHSLVFHHIFSLIEGDQPPHYVRVFNMADKGLLQAGIQPAAEAIESSPWNIAWLKLMRMFPNRRGRIIRYISKLNESQEFITSLPISSREATDSRDKWMDRFASVLYSLSVRGYVQNQRIGLRTLIYVGGAHRWPHKHIAWTARLGNPRDKPPYIQVMVMPPPAAERIRRIRPNIAEEIWSSSKINFNLYGVDTQIWRANITRIMQSISSERTLKQLEREFNVKSKGKLYIPNMEEAKVLSYISLSMYMNSLELGEYDANLGMNKEKLENILTLLKKHEIVSPQYFIHLSGLASICFVCKGSEKKVQSISRAFLKYTPSSTASLANGGRESYIISRIPEDSVYEFSTKIPDLAREEDIEIKVMRLNAYAAYTHNLYTRLLLPDGSWNDDISGLLDQIRS